MCLSGRSPGCRFGNSGDTKCVLIKHMQQVCWDNSGQLDDTDSSVPCLAVEELRRRIPDGIGLLGSLMASISLS